MARFEIGWLSPHAEDSYQEGAEPTPWVQVEAEHENAPVTRVIAADAETAAWAQDWLDDALRAGGTPSPRWLAVRFGSGATLQQVEEPITL